MSIFPEIMNQVEPIEQSAASETTSLRTYAFDIEKGEFPLQASGKPIVLDGPEAVQQNAQKALSTDRYTFPIYTSVYGNELKELIREDGTREWKQAEAQRLVREAVEYLYGIERCENFAFKWNGASLKIDYLLVTEDGAFPQEVIVE
ncbi:DUF2634 domain-containing protein [Brevibacillus sp. NRS-1366]|uniref:DUF2634 domain-containing protein n=1 Tax=Brevibacillus sp. NRS-1366 TaxID=3233899 RepID=UPI003D2191F5